MSVLVFTNDFPCEVAAGRLLVEFNPDTQHIVTYMSEIKNIEPLLKAIKTFVLSQDNPIVFFIGIYWKSNFGALFDAAGPRASIHIFSPSKPEEDLMHLFEETSNVKVHYDETKLTGPIQVAFKTFCSYDHLLPRPKNAAIWFEALNKRNIELLDLRYHDIKATQEWWTGYTQTDGDLSYNKKWTNLFQGKYTEDSLIQFGRKVIQQQKIDAKLRIDKDSKVIEYALSPEKSLKMRVIILEEGQSITATHDVISEMAGIQVSTVIYKQVKKALLDSKEATPSKKLKLDDQFGISFCAIDPDVSVLELARKYNGDGTLRRSGAVITKEQLDDFLK